MPSPTSGPLHAYLVLIGSDTQGRLATDVLRFSDEQLENVHDYIQWLFPLPTRSSAQPDAPVLIDAEIQAIRADQRAIDTLDHATDRMLKFYRRTSWWLNRQDHNHLRITRIIKSLRLLVGADAARRFHAAIIALNQTAGARVDPRSLRFWVEAAEGEGFRSTLGRCFEGRAGDGVDHNEVGEALRHDGSDPARQA